MGLFYKSFLRYLLYYNEIKRFMKSLQDILIDNDYDVVLEMATFGKPRWGSKDYKIAIHGPATKDRDTPHIHIYLLNDINYNTFNFEISLIDILCKDEINLIYQLDRSKNIMRTHRDECSWKGYSNIYKGLVEFLSTNQNIKQYNYCENGLKASIEAYNAESNSRGNALKEYLDGKGLTVLPKYSKYFEE